MDVGTHSAIIMGFKALFCWYIFSCSSNCICDGSFLTFALQMLIYYRLIWIIYMNVHIGVHSNGLRELHEKQWPGIWLSFFRNRYAFWLLTCCPKEITSNYYHWNNQTFLALFTPTRFAICALYKQEKSRTKSYRRKRINSWLFLSFYTKSYFSYFILFLFRYNCIYSFLYKYILVETLIVFVVVNE